MKQVEKRLDSGIIIMEDAAFEKRERMSRKEWKIWFANEEITEDEFRREMMEFNWPLDDRIG